MLVSGIDFKHGSEPFNPVFELRVGNQRTIVDEQVNPMKAVWQNKRRKFETYSLWEELELRIFDDQVSKQKTEALSKIADDLSEKVSQLQLLGSYDRQLSSVYFDDDNTCISTLELAEISDRMSGTLKLQFEFYPNKESDD